MTTATEPQDPQPKPARARARGNIFYVHDVPDELFALITEEANVLEVPRAAYIRGILVGTTKKDRMTAFIEGKSRAGGLTE